MYNSIFFNWIVPKDWKMKEYPINEWKKLEILINKNFPKMKIIWQKNNDNLFIYRIGIFIKSKWSNDLKLYFDSHHSELSLSIMKYNISLSEFA